MPAKYISSRNYYLKIALKILVFAIICYGIWFVLSNYDFDSWWKNCKSQPPALRFFQCAKFPNKIGTPAETLNIIYIKNCRFSIPKLTIPPNTKVTWLNNDKTERQITGDFTSGLLGKNAVFSKTFREAGTFNYSCADDPNSNGQIIVEK